jgi:hypothetical protein
MALREIISQPFSTLPDGRRVLQCHTRGDNRFTPFNCYVEAFGRINSIENHYHHAKVFEGEIIPADWREAKALKRSHYTQIGWQIGPLRLPCQPNAQRTSFLITDLGIQFYIALWFKYLRSNTHLLNHAAKFDEFEDPFRGDFPFSQADVIRKAVRERLESLLPMTEELRSLLRA